MRLISTLFVYILLTGCATQYSLIYEPKITKTFKEEPAEPFVFTLQPLYNGLIFSVQNNTDQTARIIWDKSYFIMPDGNSYKALNTDILKEETEIVAKAQYISTIPSRSTFKRFTTAAIETNKIQYQSASTFVTRWPTVTTISTKYLNEEFIRFDPYWHPTIDIKIPSTSPDIKDDNKVINELKPINNFVSNNNNLGFGLVIEHRGTEKEYRFDIRIDKVHAIRKIDVFEEGKPSRSIYMLDFTLDVPSMKWSKIGTELKD